MYANIGWLREDTIKQLQRISQKFVSPHTLVLIQDFPPSRREQPHNALHDLLPAYPNPYDNLPYTPRFP